MKINRKQRKAIKKYAKLEIKIKNKEYLVRFHSLLKIMNIKKPPVGVAEDINKTLLRMNDYQPLKKRFLDNQVPTLAFIDLQEAQLVATLLGNKDMVYYLNRFQLADGLAGEGMDLLGANNVNN